MASDATVQIVPRSARICPCGLAAPVALDNEGWRQAGVTSSFEPARETCGGMWSMSIVTEWRKPGELLFPLCSEQHLQYILVHAVRGGQPAREAWCIERWTHRVAVSESRYSGNSGVPCRCRAAGRHPRSECLTPSTAALAGANGRALPTRRRSLARVTSPSCGSSG